MSYWVGEGKETATWKILAEITQKWNNDRPHPIECLRSEG